jgi:hypothetical protein
MSKKLWIVIVVVAVVVLVVFGGPALWHMLLRMHGMH